MFSRAFISWLKAESFQTLMHIEYDYSLMPEDNPSII